MDENELKQKEAELAAREEKLKEAEEKIIHKGAKEHFYDKINIPLKYLDLIIAALFVGIIIFLALGWLKGHGYF
ncbi:MAG: hypothetical protein EOM30_03035 [Clostridia bacterium]|jgi:hypothetical protein|nr:hypothetical protein [Clostridia bacterium]NLS84624.1 hypothetical protein [Oscillospiraceae bacterium]